MQQNEPPLIRALTEYYDGKNILSTRFDCKHRKDCQGCLPSTPADAKLPKDAEDTFTEAKAAFVGDRYGECNPRLLFVSSDPGGALKRGDPEYNHISPHSRTLAGVWEGNARIMRRYVDGTETIERQRLEGTNQVAEAILREFPGVLQGEHPMRFYAHTNAAKCSVNNEGREEAHKTLFNNCREYLREEINIFRPDILVTHGGNARRGVKYAFPGIKIEEWSCPNLFVIHTQRPILWLNTYHPSGRGRALFFAQVRGENNGPRPRRHRIQCDPPGLDGYAKLIRDFISNRDS